MALNEPSTSPNAPSMTLDCDQIPGQTLEHLDLSGKNAIDATGVEAVSVAILGHPKLQTIKIEGGSSLPIAQLRGKQGADAILNVNHWNLGVLSAHAMGTLLHGNLLLGSLSLDHNIFGGSGIKAIIEGCAEAPVKSLHIRSTGLQVPDLDWTQ